MPTIRCPHCDATREVDSGRIPKARVRARCPACQGSFEIDGAALEEPLELEWGGRAPRDAEAADAAPAETAPVEPPLAPPPPPPAFGPGPEPGAFAAPVPIAGRSPLARSLPLLGVLLFVGLAARCGLGCVDRPSFLGLAWSAEGASLRRARAVVVFLHGTGGSGEDVEWFAEDVLARPGAEDVAFVLPDGTFTWSLGRGWWRTTNPAERAESVRRVLELVDDLADKGVPRDRIYVGGFSQGAMLAADVARAHRGPLGGALLLSGCDYGTAQLPGLRVFVGHGRRDSLCPFGAGQGLATALEAAGADVTFFPYDADHELAEPLRAAVAGFLAAAR